MDVRVTSEGIKIEERAISIKVIDWCQTTKDNKLKIVLNNGDEVLVDYTADEKEQARQIKKDIKKAIAKRDNERAQTEARIYCEVFSDMTSFGKPVIKGKWSYDGMLIGSKMIPVEEIEDCKFVASGYTYSILFQLKNGKYEKFELSNEEQYEQGKRAVMMIVNQISKLESGEWVK